MRNKPSNHSVMATWLGVTLLLMQSLVHAETETLFALGTAAVLDRWYARLGADATIAWESDMNSINSSIDIGYAVPSRFRLSLGGAIPVAGYHRFEWRTRLSAAVQFN